MTGVRYQTPIHELYLPVRIERALFRWGYRWVEELMGSDPFFPVTAAGPEWMEWTRTGRFHINKTKDPWIDMRGIGLTSVMVIMESIEQWRADNREMRDIGARD